MKLTDQAPEPSPKAAVPPERRIGPPRLPLDESLAAKGDQARRALDSASPEAAPDERILHELVAKQLPIVLLLHELEEQLAIRIKLSLDDPRLAFAVAKVLRETVMMASAMSKRVQGTLSTAASLRAQRRFLAVHAVPRGSSDDV